MNTWRFRCPNGHTPIRILVTNDPARRYYCTTCSSHFGELLDMKTGERTTRGLA